METSLNAWSRQFLASSIASIIGSGINGNGKEVIL